MLTKELCSQTPAPPLKGLVVPHDLRKMDLTLRLHQIERHSTQPVQDGGTEEEAD